MEVVKYGSNVKFFNQICKRCGTEYKYTKHDIEARYDVYRTGIESSEQEITEAVTCPVCGYELIISKLTSEF